MAKDLGTAFATLTQEYDMSVPGSSREPQGEIASFESQIDDVMKKFIIDNTSIPSVPIQDREMELQNLCGVSVYNQLELEQGIMKQVDQQEKERQSAMAKTELNSVQNDIRSVKQRLNHIEKALAMPPADKSTWTKEIKRQIESIKREKENKQKQMKKLLAKQKTLLSRIDGPMDLSELDDDGDKELESESFSQLENVFGLKKKESNHEKLIRTGHMTPFGTMIESKNARPNIVPSAGLTDFEKYLLSQEELNNQKVSKKRKESTDSEQTKPKKAKSDGNSSTTPNSANSLKSLKLWTPKTKKIKLKKEKLGTLMQGDKILRNKKYYPWKETENVIDLDDNLNKNSSDSDYVPSNDESNSDGNEKNKRTKKMKSKSSVKDLSLSDDDDCEELEEKKSSKKCRYFDDGNEVDYVKRMRKWRKEKLKVKHARILAGEDVDDEVEEYQDLGDSFKVPSEIWNKLYKYQQTCVQWLWELHCQQCGGIIGDEMGLGKTIQIIAFLAGLARSKLITRGDKFRGLGPVLIVTPTTVMQQWVKEFHTWWPLFRVSVLHESGSYSGTKESLIRHVSEQHGILITSYNGVNIHQQLLLRYDWHYIILDEGHKIRNPDAQITLACKQFATPHRLILSGSPLQNNLKELWSLFDFIFPGKLGTLPVFMEQFSVPITLGGYANASQIQIRVAYKCATVLRDTINPYLLRRMKSDVKMNLNLPNKNEQVLFCQLTDEQRQCYKEYLDSDQLKSILNSRLQVFVGLVSLRKICNHPDLYSGGPKHFGDVDLDSLPEEERFGFWKKSGKMIVIEAILKIWHQQSHRVLLFSQSRQMLHILENFVKIRNYTYLKMDGTTSIGSRQPLINKFNTDASIFVFLLTTKVGGLGINLTGADRVVIFDPDWNPSTDLQAKERVWRIGQKKDVTIYRLVTTGTIEEKIYHRQIFKQFLTNRVLKDPRQRRFFKNNELYELFTLQEQGTEGAETLAVFAGTGSEIKPPVGKKRSSSASKKKAKVANAHKLEKNVKESGTEKIEKNKNEEDTEKLDKNKNEVDTEKLDKNKNEVDTEKLDIKPKDGEINDAKECESQTTVSVAENSSMHNSVNIEKADEVAEEKIENGVDDAVNAKESSELSESKCEQMRELARRLSQQIANSFKNKELNQEKNTVKNGKKKSSRRNKRKEILFEGERVNNLIRQEVYQSNNDDDKERSAKHDDYVLKKLFAKTGLQSALRHDVIMEAPESDYAIVEGEAERVAKDSVKKLKQSRRYCFQAAQGIPNWTGSRETLPPQIAKPRFGQKKNSQLINITPASTSTSTSSSNQDNPNKQSQSSDTSFNTKTNIFVAATTTNSEILSSQQLLSKIKERNVFDNDDSQSDDDLPNSLPQLTTEHDELLVDLRNFIAFQSTVNGQATTQELLQHFKQKLPSEKSALFRALLYQVCDFTKETRTWYLKAEFR